MPLAGQYEVFFVDFGNRHVLCSVHLLSKGK